MFDRKEYMKAYNKEYRRTHKKQKKEYMKKYRQIHKEHRKKYWQEWCQKNKEQNRERYRRWYQNNLKHWKEYLKKWCQTPRGKASAKKTQFKRRALGKPILFTKKELELLIIQSKHCFYCGEELDNKFHIDHKIPLFRGGKNIISNFVCACATCNLRKGTKTVGEFLKQLNEEKICI
jgi:5-methylcytosine-specific restriction endonuclease McrA